MANEEKSLRDILTERLIETITNTEDGAGSDLGFAEWNGDEWIEVGYETSNGSGIRGSLDIHHVVSEVLNVLQEQRIIKNGRSMTVEEYLASYGDQDV